MEAEERPLRTKAWFRERFGRAQGVAVLLLLILCLQVMWLSIHTPLSAPELDYTVAGTSTGDAPVALSPVTVWAGRLAIWAPHFKQGEPHWSMRLPALIVGLLLGASLWYVARRLYGNAGGYLALFLYTFSPVTISYCARLEPEIIVAWGVFGCVFTAIAVAHTLYAPREVVLWNWKRILLLGVAIGVGAGARLSALIAVPVGLAFMLYLVPGRRRAAVAIMGAGTAVGILVFALFHGLHGRNMLADAIHTGLNHPVWNEIIHGTVWKTVGLMVLGDGPGFAFLLLLALAVLIAWRRARYFGNFAPLLAAALMIVFGIVFPNGAGPIFLVVAFPFLFLFIAGIWADLLQSSQSSLALGIVLAAGVMQAYFNVVGLLGVH